jgi:hypothetical protein
MSAIRVAIRVRPSVHMHTLWSIDSNAQTIGIAGSQVQFSFTRVFEPSTRNFQIYEEMASDVVEAVMTGTNGTIFAYGATGSGKTYTMMGEGDEPGVILFAIDHVFRYIGQHRERTFTVRFGYFEIYNEKIRDLLDVRTGNDMRVKFTQQTAKSAQFLTDTIIAADVKRATSSTQVNDRSSRSHAIVRIAVESEGDGQKLISVLNLVDLAGSECQKNTNAEGDRQIEASMINRSLLALSKLIDALQNSKQILVYRESKLTLYLQDSLGGTSQTAIICAINSELNQKSTSENTLRFASKAMKVRNQPKVNETISEKCRIEQLIEENRRLKERLTEAGTSRNSFEEVESLRTQNRRLENENDDLAAALAEIESQHDQERAQLTLRVETLEKEREAFFHTTDPRLVEVIREKEALEQEVQELKTKLLRKEAEVKGARFTQSIIQAKLEQKDLTIIQLGQRIQAQREELKSQKFMLQQRPAPMAIIPITGNDIPIRKIPDESLTFPGYESVIAQLKEKQSQFRPRESTQPLRPLQTIEANVSFHPGETKRPIGRKLSKSVLSTSRRVDHMRESESSDSFVIDFRQIGTGHD